MSERELRYASLMLASSSASRGRAEAKKAVQEVSWFESAEEQSDAGQRLVLRVRAFERGLPTTASWHWNEAVKYYGRESWALEELNNHLFYLGYDTHRELRFQQADLSGIEEWMTHDDDGFTIMLGAFLRVIQQVLPLLGTNDRTVLLRRRLREVAGWENDPAAVFSHLERLAQHFDILLARALRQRNGIVHGLDGHEEVVLSVDDFVSRLAASYVGQAVYGAATDEDLVKALANSRDDSRRAFHRLENGCRPVSRILYRRDFDN